MLVERYEPVNLFELVPLERDEVLDQLDRLLDEDALFQVVKGDLARRHPHTLTRGRHSTPVEVILRMLVVKHLYNWSYEQAEVFVADSITLRQFCRIYLNGVPDDTTLIRWANLIRSETMHQLLDHVVGMAHRLKVTRGRKLRTDGTVVESNIRYPTDSGLLADGVRVLSRAIKRAKRILVEGVELATEAFRDRTRSARNQARRIAERARKRRSKSKAELKGAYHRLISTTKANVRQARQVLEALRREGSAQAERVADTLEQFIPRVEQVIEQAVRRVFEDEIVPAREKIVSLFEPHTNIIRRGKRRRPVEFGHKVWLDEVEGGIVTNWRVLEGNPADCDQWQPSLQHHLQQFGRPPHQASADRGVYSAANEAYAAEIGVRRIILPKAGWKSALRRKHEQQRYFKRGRRFHAGIEGRISVLKRRYGLDRCLYHGEEGFERWVGWGIIARNLAVVGTVLAAR